MRLPSKLFAAAFTLGVLTLPVYSGESERTPTELKDVNVTEHPGGQIDLDLTFIAEDGYPKPLREYFAKGRPVLLNLVYYTCPMLCNLVLNGQTAALREVPWTPGKEFEVVTISIDPTEDFGMARNKKATYLASYERETTGWHFLADHQGNVAKLASQIGFGYKLDPVSGQYAHAAAIFVLTPEGKISRYLYGVKFRAFDVRMALAEASEGKIGMSVEKLLLYCFHYDPQSRSYAPTARNIMRAGGVLMILLVGSALFVLFRRERRERSASAEHAGDMVTAK